MQEGKKVAIIGTGIAGLATGYWLKKKDFEVTLFEQSDQIGGAIRTIHRDGYTIDLGPNSTLETSEVLKGLVTELGLTHQKVYANEAAKKRYILKNGALHPVPMSPLSFLRTPLFSWQAKLNLLKEPFKSATTDPEISLAAFVKYRLGQEFLDYAINPFVAGVYAGDPAQLSTAAGFPKLHALEQRYGSLIKGAIQGARERKRRKEVAKDRARMFSFRDGMGVFPQALATHLQGNIQLQKQVDSITALPKGGFDLTIKSGNTLETHSFDQIVVGVPTHVQAKLLQDLDPAMATVLDQVVHPPVSVLFTAFRAEDVQRPLDGFGYLIPEKEHKQILGSIWSSTIFPGRVPEGEVAFTTFVGGTRQPHLARQDEEKLRLMVLQELDSIVGLRGDPTFIHQKLWPKAIPQYRVGYKQVQAQWDRLEAKYSGLHFAGNFRRGISVGDSVLSAHETVQRIVA